MGYILLSVMFYTAVRYGFKVWVELFWDRKETDKGFALAHDISNLERRVTSLEAVDLG